MGERIIRNVVQNRRTIVVFPCINVKMKSFSHAAEVFRVPVDARRYPEVEKLLERYN